MKDKLQHEQIFGVFVSGSLQFYSKNHEEAVKVASDWCTSSGLRVWLLEINEKLEIIDIDKPCRW